MDDDTLDIFILDGMWEANHMIPEVELDGDDVGVEDDKCAAEVVMCLSALMNGLILVGWLTISLALRLTMRNNLIAFYW